MNQENDSHVPKSIIDQQTETQLPKTSNPNSPDWVIRIAQLSLESIHDDRHDSLSQKDWSQIDQQSLSIKKQTEQFSAQEAGRAEQLYISTELNALRGEIVLIVGTSGSGKSLLTQLLLNLESKLTETLAINRLQPSVDACMQVKLANYPKPFDALALPYPKELRSHLGIMFQSLGLFEDLTVQENFNFANDHAVQGRSDTDWQIWRAEMIKKLKLSPSILPKKVSTLSGGEKQRVALGRLLASRAKVMILDEPSSALDFVNAQRTVELIKEAHKHSNSELTLIVTHDLEAFLPIADRVWFLNEQRCFVDHFPPRDASYYHSKFSIQKRNNIRSLSQKDLDLHQAHCHDLRLLSYGGLLRAQLDRAIQTVSSPWLKFYLFKFFKQNLIQALFFHLSASFVLGAVATYFAFNLKLGSIHLSLDQSLEVSRFVIPTFFEQMLSGFSVVLYRAIIPLFTCLCFAARSGTAMTAYLAEMRDRKGRQWEAFETFGVRPYWFFTPPMLISMSLSCLMISYLSFWSATLGAFLASTFINPLCAFEQWIEHYFRLIRLSEDAYLFGFKGTGTLILKTMTSGLVIALISAYHGSRPKTSALDTMKSLSKANVHSVIMILIIFFCILILESKGLL